VKVSAIVPKNSAQFSTVLFSPPPLIQYHLVFLYACTTVVLLYYSWHITCWST